MKNIIISVLILLCYSEIDAQIYSNQPKYFPQGTSWVWSTKDFGCEHLSFVISRYSIKGSKIFNQKEYYCVEKISSGIVEEECYIREEDEKVFAYYPSFDKEVLYYNFNWADGEGCALVDFYELSYLSIRTEDIHSVILTDGVEYAITQPYGIIRTIGKTCDSSLFSLFPDGVLDNGARCFVSSFVRNGVELLHEKNHVGIPVVNETNFGQLNKNTSAYFDLQGRLSSQPKRGIFISNGRKVVVK